jgi:hypothetical protein
MAGNMARKSFCQRRRVAGDGEATALADIAKLLIGKAACETECGEAAPRRCGRRECPLETAKGPQKAAIQRLPQLTGQHGMFDDRFCAYI